MCVYQIRILRRLLGKYLAHAIYGKKFSNKYSNSGSVIYMYMHLYIYIYIAKNRDLCTRGIAGKYICLGVAQLLGRDRGLRNLWSTTILLYNDNNIL